MASFGGDKNNQGTAISLTPTKPEAEFGLGICDATYRLQTWNGMGKLFQKEALSDVMLMAEGQTIRCHKFLLGAASEYFFNRLVVETGTVNSNVLEIKGIAFSTLKVIVSYLYTGNINVTKENAKAVLPCCKMLNLTSACATCEGFALEMINPGNCIGLYQMGTAHDFQYLSAKALHVMENNFFEVVAGREFLTMSETGVAEYIQNRNLKIPNENPVFEAVKSWVRHQPQSRESSFPRLIAHVRLRYCSPQYLTQVVSKEPLMNNPAYQKILGTASLHPTDADLLDCSMQTSTAIRKGYTSTNTLIAIGGASGPKHDSRTNCWRLEKDGWGAMQQVPEDVSEDFFSTCVVKDGLLVTGGYNNNDGDHDDEPVSQCWLLSTSTCQWSPLRDLNIARARHASVCVGGQVYVLAGVGSDEKEIASMECLRKLSDKWERLPDMPKALRHIMAVSYRERIYVFGGGTGDYNDSQSVFVYDTNSTAWQTLPNMPQICMCGSTVVWEDKIFIVGGFEQACMSYDPLLAQWSTLSQCMHEHADASALVWKDRILVCGGRSSETVWDGWETGDTSVIEEYDPETDTWTMSQIELPQKLSSHFVFSIASDITQGDNSASENKVEIPQNRLAFLIGDATINKLHGVKTSCGKVVAVHVRPEATFSEISRELDRVEIAKGVGELFLVCGLSEAGNKQSLGEIKTNLVGLVSKAKDLCGSLKVSSILPATKSNERINQLNYVIRDVCKQLGVDFVDNDKNFLLRDSTRDETAFRANTNTLSAQGTLRLMRNMDLAIHCLEKAHKKWNRWKKWKKRKQQEQLKQQKQQQNSPPV